MRDASRLTITARKDLPKLPSATSFICNTLWEIKFGGLVQNLKTGKKYYKGGVKQICYMGGNRKHSGK